MHPCPHCQTLNAPNAKFCNECGQPLSAPATNIQEIGVQLSDSTVGGGVTGRDDTAISNVNGPVIIAKDGSHVVIGGSQPAREPARLSDAEQLAHYLEKVKVESNVLRLGGLSSEASDPQKRASERRNPGALAQVFIPLRVDRYQGEPGEGGETGKQGNRGIEGNEGNRDATRRKQLTAIEALSDEKATCAVLLGQPGAGKSSVLRYLAYRLAEAYLQPQQLAESLPAWKAGALLPVFISLAKLADALPADPRAKGLADKVAAAIRDEVEDRAELQGFASRLWREARERGAFFLFDGLDEVAPDKRAVVKEAVAQFMAGRARSRAVVTCRTFSYGDPQWRLEGWRADQLEPLSAQEQQTFIERWYTALIESDPVVRAAYEKKARTLQRAVLAGDARQLQEIAENPLLLTLIAIVHTHRDELPRSRVKIYDECVQLLLLRWQTRRQPNAPLRSVVEALSEAAPDRPNLESALLFGLYELAYTARKGGALRQGETTLIDLYALRAALSRRLPEKALAVFEAYCGGANGLLLGVGSRRLPDRPAAEPPTPCFAFPHPSFEEYLAARYLATLDQPEATLAALNAESDRWFYVGLFLAEYHAIVSQRARDLLELVEQLLATQTAMGDVRGSTIRQAHGSPRTDKEQLLATQTAAGEIAWRNVWLAGVCWNLLVAEFPERRETNQALEKEVRRRLTQLCADSYLRPVERADAGRVLAILGDERDLEELVEVPAGKFWMGSDKASDSDAFDSELPQHEVELAAFRIGKYPVTVGGWKKFVAATDYQCDPDSLNGYDNHPAHDVSWQDTRVFCEWLTGEWRKAGKISANEVVRLPTEAEWEKAARGGLPSPDFGEGAGVRARIYPWGNGFSEAGPQANTVESRIGSTCAVGLFPTGASPYGCLDMSGNVLEWCQSKYKSYPYKIDDGREELQSTDSRVLRGGSFYNPRGRARCASRYDLGPDPRDDFIGFRVVVSTGSRF